jgi:hypothetical protein
VLWTEGDGYQLSPEKVAPAARDEVARANASS